MAVKDHKDNLTADPPTNSTAITEASNYIICDRSGMRVTVAEGLKKEWNGAMVRAQDFETRHPQDFVRSRKEHYKGSPRPEQPDQFIAFPADGLDNLQANFGNGIVPIEADIGTGDTVLRGKV